MSENPSLFGSGLRRVMHNKRYIFWFWLLNLAIAFVGTTALRESAHTILDHSLYAENLTQGFHLSAYLEMVSLPNFGASAATISPAVYSTLFFFVFTILFLPGVLLGYSSRYRLPREDFFRACGRNLWRFIRLLILSGIVMGIVAGILFAINGAIVKGVAENTNEVLPFELRMLGMFIIFLVMTTLRIWFDLAETDIVLHDQRAVRKSIGAALLLDQRAVRKSIGAAFMHTFRNLFRLLANYVAVTVVAAIILVGGIWIWNQFLSAESVLGAFVLSQAILFFLLIPRFWQRGIAVSYWQQKMLAPIVAPVPVFNTSPAPAATLPDLSPAPAATLPDLSPAPAATLPDLSPAPAAREGMA